MADKTIEQVLAECSADWMSVPGGVGTAIGMYSGEPCLRVMVVRTTPQILRTIPERVEGFRVDIVETGIFRARQADPNDG